MTAESPLRGRRVLVTRPARQSGGLRAAFERAGAHAIAIPAFRLEAVAGSTLETRLGSGQALDADTIVFTSPSAVGFFFDLAGQRGVDVLAGLEVAAVGPSTATALARYGARAGLIAEPHTAEGLVATLRSAGAELAGRRVLYPKAADARDVLEDELSASGAHVDAVTIYGAVPETLDDPVAAGEGLTEPPDVVTFASPTAAIHLEATLTPPVFAKIADGLRTRSVTACIGPVTAEAVARLGYQVEVVADTHTADGLVDAVIDYYTKET